MLYTCTCIYMYIYIYIYVQYVFLKLILSTAYHPILRYILLLVWIFLNSEAKYPPANKFISICQTWFVCVIHERCIVHVCVCSLHTPVTHTCVYDKIKVIYRISSHLTMKWIYNNSGLLENTAGGSCLPPPTPDSDAGPFTKTLNMTAVCSSHGGVPFFTAW